MTFHDIRQAITLGLDHPAVFDHYQGKTRDTLTLHLGLDEVVYCMRLPDDLVRVSDSSREQQRQNGNGMYLFRISILSDTAIGGTPIRTASDSERLRSLAQQLIPSLLAAPYRSRF